MLKVQKSHIMLPFKNFQDTGHYHLALTFSRIVYSSVYLNITNTSWDCLTKGLDLKTFCCLSVLYNNILQLPTLILSRDCTNKSGKNNGYRVSFQIISTNKKLVFTYLISNICSVNKKIIYIRSIISYC